ncbi:MAG: mucoidy inhibitor MuiA family protein [Crocinitomix sp.]|nr:mucoidy inhibitor MuiA family protein [Crocinitomix sp.]
MKFILSITFALFLFSPSLLANPTVDLTTKVDEATVFTQGAQLTREKRISLKKGENVFRFVDLEQAINANSIQLYGMQRNEGFTVIYTSYFQESKPKIGIDKAVKAIRDSIQAVASKMTTRNNKISNLQKEKQLVQNHNKIEGQAGETFVARLGELADFYRNRTNEIDVLIMKLEAENRHLSNLTGGLNKRLSVLERTTNMGVIETKIYAQKAMTVNLELNYLVDNVSWTPFYEIKSKGFEHPLNTVCKATVSQNTGIEWKDVNVTLSTKKPEILAAIPKVHPWALYFQNKRTDYSNSNQLMYSGAISNASISNASLPLELSGSYQNVNTGPSTPNTTDYLEQFKHATHKMINKEYESTMKYSISGDGGVAVMVLEEFEMETKYIYYAVPKYDCNVYLLAEISKWKQYDLIPAFGNVFLEGSYVGKLFIDPSKVEKDLQLMLGKDNEITVERRKIKQYSEKKMKLSGGIETTEIGIELIVKSKKKFPIDLVIKDQVPISKSEEIVVNVKNVSRAKQNGKTGTLTWAYELAPGEEKEHAIIYEVKKPKGKFIGNF